MNVNQILEIARKEIGTKEYPANSNRVKYNTWFYGREVSGSAYPWCMAFVQWVFDQAGHRLSPVTASCGAFIRGNPGKIVTGNYRPGDIVFFSFDGNPDADHVGIVESNDGLLVTIEGNTGLTSQDNGGAVMRRKDHGRYAISAYRPDYESEETEMDFSEEMKKYRCGLQDNDAGEWSREAREWAVKTGLVEGGGTMEDGTVNFMWQDFLTREQMVVLLKRFAEMMGK